MKRFDHLDNRPLRSRARLLACAVIALLSLVVGEILATRASEQVKAEAGARLLQITRDMAYRLSRDLSARAGELLLLSQTDSVRTPGDIAALPALQKMKSSAPCDAGVAMTDTRGNVVLATDGLLPGTSVAAHPAYVNGRNGLWTSNVRQADLFAPVTAGNPGAESQVIQMATPLRDTAGELTGVLAMQMSWQCVEQLRQATLRPHGSVETVQLMVFGPDGSVLLAPNGTHAGLSLAAQFTNTEGLAPTARWRDGVAAVTSVAESRPFVHFPGFGWRVVARDTHATLQADLSATRRKTLPWVLGAGGLCLLIAWWGIGRKFAPVDDLEHALQQRRALRHASAARPKRRTDVQQIAAAVARFQTSLKPAHEAAELPDEPSHHDPLTGLYNLDYLNVVTEHLGAEIDSQRAEICVLCLDLDGLPGINERYGADAGNQVLIQTAKRLRKLARKNDLAFRIEGGEFMLLLHCPAGEGLALSKVVAARVLTEVQRPLSYRTLSSLYAGCRIGAAIWPTHGLTLAEAMARAEEALRAARNSGGSKFRQYAASGDDSAAAPSQEAAPG